MRSYPTQPCTSSSISEESSYLVSPRYNPYKTPKNIQQKNAKILASDDKILKSLENIIITTTKTVGLDLTNSVLNFFQKHHSSSSISNTPNVQLKHNVDYMMTFDIALETLKKIENDQKRKIDAENKKI